MRLLACIFLVLTAVGCRSFEEPEFPHREVVRNSTIGNFRTDAGGQARIVADDMVVAGRVVSSDREGNFFRSFIIDDGTGALEIMAGMYDLDATYHPGQLVEVRAKGLAVGFRDGIMQIGLPPMTGSSYATEYFAHPLVIEQYVSTAHDVVRVEPLEVNISELTAVDLPGTEPVGTALCGRLVRLDDLALDPLETATTWAITQPEPTTDEVKFRTTPADSIGIVTSGYAGFAGSDLPRQTTIALTGILLYGKGDGSRDHFMLKLRSLDDVD